MEPFNKIIQDTFNSLPIGVKEALARAQWKQRVRQIALDNTLGAEKSQFLETETLLVLYGLEPPENYISNIIDGVELSEEQAEKIADEVFDKIIMEVERQLKTIDATTHKKDAETNESEPPANIKQEAEHLSNNKTTTIEIPPNTLPMIEPGEGVHDTVVSEVRSKEQEVGGTDAEVRKNQNTYGGADPYREPI